MKPDFDYSSVPGNIVYCLNNQCPRAGECLRHQVSQHILAKGRTITIVTPGHIETADKGCPFFISDKKVRFGRGMTHMLDKLPHNDAVAIKQQMLRYFGRTLYYRLWRKERLFSLEQQDYIRQLFRNKGITEEPMYDEYVEQYNW